MQKSYSSLTNDIHSAGEMHDSGKVANSAAVQEIANSLKSELKVLKSELNALNSNDDNNNNNNNNSSSSSSSSSFGGGAEGSPIPKPPRPSRNSVATSGYSGSGGGGAVVVVMPDIRASLPRSPPPPVPPVPSNKAQFDDELDTIDEIVEIKANNRTSKRLSDKEKKVLGSYFQVSGDSGGGGSPNRRGSALDMISTGCPRDDRIDFLRRDAIFLQNSSGFTVTKLELIGNQSKRGTIQKKSKVLGKYKKKWFILEGNRLEYYESRDDSLNSSRCKVAILNSSAAVKSTEVENSFSLESIDDSGKAQLWSLLTDTENDMLAWIEAIIAHLHLQYKRQNNLEGDFLDDDANDANPNGGDISTSFWKVPASTQNPVGIRTVPFVEGPKTNNGVYPGEIIEVMIKSIGPDLPCRCDNAILLSFLFFIFNIFCRTFNQSIFCYNVFLGGSIYSEG